MMDLLHKNFKTTVLKMFKELKDVEKVKKTIYKQSGDINKKKQKRNSEAKKNMITEVKIH